MTWAEVYGGMPKFWSKQVSQSKSESNLTKRVFFIKSEDAYPAASNRRCLSPVSVAGNL